MSKQKTGWELAEEGMQAAFTFADEDWKDAAYNAVRETAAWMDRFTVDDIYERIPKHVATPNKSALGPIMRICKKEGIIERTDSFQRSNRPEQHADPKVVWRSLIRSEALGAA